MLTIFKYKLEKTSQEIEMPVGAKILTLQSQDGIPHMWALVDSEAIKVKRTFEIFATGQVIPPAPRVYIGTFQLLHGSLIYHCFELKHHYNETT